MSKSDISDGMSVRPGGQMEQPESNVRREPVGPGMVGVRREVQDISVVQKGNRLQISATVDADGIDQLKLILDIVEEELNRKYAEVLKMLQ
jgi:hypothetical protein